MDIEMLESMYKTYYKNVYNYIAFRINNHFDAEELASLVFEKAIGAWGRYNPAFPMEAWLMGIAKNTVTDHMRKKRRSQNISLDEIVNFASLGKQPCEVAVLNEQNRALMVAMSKLKEHERQILSMKFATDLKYHEIAKQMGVGESNVRVTTHRALKKLRKILEEEGWEHEKNQIYV